MPPPRVAPAAPFMGFIGPRESAMFRRVGELLTPEARSKASRRHCPEVLPSPIDSAAG